MGFEFESADWKVYRHFPFMGRRPAERHEVVHAGSHFDIEGDDADGSANLEFVTEPFDATPAGLATLNTAVRGMRAIAARLETHLDKRGVGAGGFLKLRHHYFNRPFVELRSVGNATRVKMQATQGVSLEDIPTMMRLYRHPGRRVRATNGRAPGSARCHVQDRISPLRSAHRKSHG